MWVSMHLTRGKKPLRGQHFEKGMIGLGGRYVVDEAEFVGRGMVTAEVGGL